MSQKKWGASGDWDEDEEPRRVSRWLRALSRSGMMTGLGLVVLLAALGFATYEHGRGNLHKLEQKIRPHRVEPQPLPPEPGGQPALRLERLQFAGAASPEFLSMTMLPGRGLNVLEIRAFIPGRGEVNLLAAPSLEDAAAAMTGRADDANGRQSLLIGSPFTAPWAGRIWGTRFGQARVGVAWRGHTMSLPAVSSSKASTGGEAPAPIAEGGLMLDAVSQSTSTTTMPDGGLAKATFTLNDPAARWPSKTEMTLTVLLSSHSLEMTATARNAGTQPEPVGLGWRPRFAVLNGDRGQLRLRIPAEMRAEMRPGGEPTGRLLPVAGTPYDFTANNGERLGTLALDDCYTDLRQEFLDNGPIAEFIDPVAGYGLRLTVLSSEIHAMCVTARPGENWVSIEPRYNLDDPFGREWNGEDAGMVVLEPGESTEWRIRLELVPTTSQ